LEAIKNELHNEADSIVQEQLDGVLEAERLASERVVALEGALAAVKPLFHSHGPVTGSEEWQAAWKNAAAALAALTPTGAKP
jgi:hypothetical protein